MITGYVFYVIVQLVMPCDFMFSEGTNVQSLMLDDVICFGASLVSIQLVVINLWRTLLTANTDFQITNGLVQWFTKNKTHK